MVGALNLVNEMLNNDVNNLVFSSTAAVFGNPVTDKIAEDHPKNPINPYGQSKLMVENMLQDICPANDFNATCLRYFNAAGARESGEIGDARDPETHLIPNILKAALSNESSLKVFGNDYPTPDGTCVRDYVHVTDLAQAHLLGLNICKKIKDLLPLIWVMVMVSGARCYWKMRTCCKKDETLRPGYTTCRRSVYTCG